MKEGGATGECLLAMRLGVCWAMENFKKNIENFDGESSKIYGYNCINFHYHFKGSKVHLICSTVSSKLLQSIAKVEGIQFSS